jgi:hypothetical protein
MLRRFLPLSRYCFSVVLCPRRRNPRPRRHGPPGCGRPRWAAGPRPRSPRPTQPPSGIDSRAIKDPVQRGYNYSLEIRDIKSLGPATVEHEPMEVSFTLTITTRGLVGEFPELRRLKICPKEQVPGTTTCKEINSPRVRFRHTGKVQALAPVAGAASPMTLVVLMEPPGEQYGQWTEVAEASKKIPVAARYEASIESFETLHTRSRTEDTAFMNLQALREEPAGTPI